MVIFPVLAQPSRYIYVTLLLENNPPLLLVDRGAMSSCLSEEFLRRYLPHINHIQELAYPVTGADGAWSNIQG